jgi:hypothetical protein
VRSSWQGINHGFWRAGSRSPNRTAVSVQLRPARGRRNAAFGRF